ncbi:MAG TPA: hypothetical protein VF658_21815 [Pyrinomonadaceae bacterium]
MSSMRRWMGQQQGNAPQAEAGDEGQSDFRRSQSGGPGAQRGGSLRQMGGLGMLLRHAEEFNLTDEQQEQLGKMQVNFELEKVDLQAALSKAKIIFRSLVRDHDTPEQDVLDAIDRLSMCEANLRKMRYRHLKAAHNVLDDDQRRNLKTQHKQRMREKMQGVREKITTMRQSQ